MLNMNLKRLPIFTDGQPNCISMNDGEVTLLSCDEAAFPQDAPIRSCRASAD